MSLAMTPAMAGRTMRLTSLVSKAEAALIAKRAEAAGLSVSAYLRDCALGASANADTDEAQALRQVDALVARMEADLDRATAACPPRLPAWMRRDRLVRSADAPRGPRRTGHDLDGWGQGSGEQTGGPSGAPGAPGDDRRDLTAGRRRATPRSEAAGGYADIAVGPSQRSRRGRFARIRFKATR